jgi:hypothetical protein
LASSATQSFQTRGPRTQADHRERAHLGTVEAADERSAKAAAVAQLDLDEEQRKRLAVREQKLWA